MGVLPLDWLVMWHVRLISSAVLCVPDISIMLNPAPLPVYPTVTHPKLSLTYKPQDEYIYTEHTQRTTYTKHTEY